VPLGAASLTRAAWNWKEALGPDLAVEAQTQFSLPAGGLSHDGGWPALLIAECQSCPKSLLVYAGVREVSNSVFSITIQGVSELAA